MNREPEKPWSCRRETRLLLPEPNTEVGHCSIRCRIRLWVSCGTAISSTECPLWVKSRHRKGSTECPLYPQKRTLVERVGMSALCQKRTHAVQQAAWPFDRLVRASCTGGILKPSVLAAFTLIRDRRGWWPRGWLFVRSILLGRDCGWWQRRRLFIQSILLDRDWCGL